MRQHRHQSDDPTKIAAQGWSDEDDRQETRPRRTRGRGRAEREKPAGPKDWIYRVAEYWIAKGTEILGDRPPVNVDNLADRLRQKTQADPYFAWALKDDLDAPGRPRDAKGWERSERYAHDLLVRMTEIFWDNVTDEHELSSLQFLFLRDFWDDLHYQAQTSIRVKRLRQRNDVVTRKVGATDDQIAAWRRNREVMEQQKVRSYVNEMLAEDRDAVVRDPSVLDRLNAWRAKVAGQRKDTTTDE